MRFGLFGSAQSNNAGLGTGSGQGFHDYIDFNVEAERLGYYSTFLVEHHFTGWGQVSSTLNLLTWLAAKTKSLRIGTATMVLPWHNPVLLAEQAATLELLSGGRLDLGVGKGYRHTEFTGFNIPIEESEARFDEALDVMLKAWSAKERFSHRGRFWTFNDIVVEPNIPARPAMWMGAGSEPSIRKVAARGFNLLLDQFAEAKLIGQRIEIFKKAVEEQRVVDNPSEIAVARELFIADNETDKQAALERLNDTRQRMIHHARAANQTKGSHILSYADNGRTPPTESTLIGTVAEVRDKVATLQEAGVEYLILNILGGSRPTLQRFATEIMPELRRDAVDELVSPELSCLEAG